MRRLLKQWFKQSSHTSHADAPAEVFAVQGRLLEAAGITNPVILDVGAHLGETIGRYKEVFATPRIYSFEPFPENAARLATDFADDPAVTIIPMAVADKAGRKTFFVNGYDATNSLLKRPEGGRQYYPADAGHVTEIEVDVTSLDEFISSKNLPEIHILKMDIQGGELMALQGALQALRSRSISLIYTEAMFTELYANNPLFFSLWQLLHDEDYSLVNLFDLHTAENGQLTYGDALFASAEFRRSYID